MRPRSGWFSDRSACYLAAVRPVSTQETGFTNNLPSGKGVLAFSTIEEVSAAVDLVASEFTGHQAAACELAEELFITEVVLGEMLTVIGLL